MEERVQKIIANSGLMSRRKAEEMIIAGKVKVNDKTITIGDKASKEDKIVVDNKIVEQTRKRYLIFNNPPNCLTTLYDPQDRPTIFKYIHEKERLIPVGRLDFKTEGLLMLTNDGDFANKIMHPSYQIKKTYHITLDSRLKTEDQIRIENGVEIDGKKTAPSKIFPLEPQSFTYAIRVSEGRNRIVRKLFFSQGYKTKRLMRTKIGNLELGNLKKGRYRDLSPKEINMVFSKN